MAKNYNYRTTTRIISGGYPGEPVGVIPDDTSWHTTSVAGGSHEVTYHYRDSNSSQNENSSRIKVIIRDDWLTEIDNRNNLTVYVTSWIISIVRDDVVGNPHAGGTAKRNIYISRYAGAPVLWSFSNDDISTNHAILDTPYNLGNYTFTLEPGQNASRAVIYFKNCLPGHENDPLPSIYVDVLAMGTEFRNPLPADYRPGMVLDANGVWQSHNRATGNDLILKANGVWQEMRTNSGGVDSDNPPLILHPNGYKNMRLIGQE